jgi:hypothetical protein
MRPVIREENTGKEGKFEFRVGGVKAFTCFLLSCAIASLAFTRASGLADLILLFALWAALITFTVRKVTLLWRYRHDPEARNAHIGAGSGGLFKRRPE